MPPGYFQIKTFKSNGYNIVNLCTNNYLILIQAEKLSSCIEEHAGNRRVSWKKKN